ncbi:uncharacterized protein DNG_02155 [Cephalotrichum gorgonifer]|uniref:CorA domain-containing protein n=1 Tax=Cephalotrichum gorgonifer TaxID=2041049 RepID=A0AAE8SSU4_9PEZI|nr:uncharacterized protein DNG_02155 [Cephalotrichum gorgonifer]
MAYATPEFSQHLGFAKFPFEIQDMIWVFLAETLELRKPRIHYLDLEAFSNIPESNLEPDPETEMEFEDYTGTISGIGDMVARKYFSRRRLSASTYPGRWMASICSRARYHALKHVPDVLGLTFRTRRPDRSKNEAKGNYLLRINGENDPPAARTILLEWLTDNWKDFFPYAGMLTETRFKLMRPFLGPDWLDLQGWKKRFHYEIHHDADVTAYETSGYSWRDMDMAWPTGQVLDADGKPPPEDQYTVPDGAFNWQAQQLRADGLEHVILGDGALSVTHRPLFNDELAVQAGDAADYASDDEYLDHPDPDDGDTNENTDFLGDPRFDVPCIFEVAQSGADRIRPAALDIPPPQTAKEDSDNISSEEHEIANHGNLPVQERRTDPNRFSFFSSAWETTVHAARFGDLVLPGEDIGALFNTSKQEGDGAWWLNMDNPTREEVRIICKGFGIHPLTIEDIIAQESREKIELFPSYYFACFGSFRHLAQQEGTHYVPFNIYVVVFREGTLSFSFAPNTHAASVRARISRLKDFVSLSSDWICYALIDDIVDSFAPAINEVELESDTIEDQVLVARPDDNQELFRRIGKARKNITGLMRLLGGKADVLRGFTKRCNENYKVTPRMDIALYLGDIRDHVITMVNSLFHSEKMLSRSQGNYLAQLSIDNITQGNRTNEGLTRVTVIATVLVPLNVVCGLFGMNVRVPWQDDNNLNAFLGIMGGIILCAATCLLLARRMRYI